VFNKSSVQSKNTVFLSYSTTRSWQHFVKKKTLFASMFTIVKYTHAHWMGKCSFSLILEDITVIILDIIYLSVSYLKHNVSESGFCLRLQVEPTQMGLIDSYSLSPDRRHTMDTMLNVRYYVMCLFSLFLTVKNFVLRLATFANLLNVPWTKWSLTSW
jgi:hypothetical protein